MQTVSGDLTSSAQRSSWALTSRPDRGRPTLHGWWAPITLHYIERWGQAALFTRFTVSSHSRPTNITLIRSRGCTASDGNLHCLAAIGLRHRTSPSGHRATAGPHHRTPQQHRHRHGRLQLFRQALRRSMTSHLSPSPLCYSISSCTRMNYIFYYE